MTKQKSEKGFFNKLFGKKGCCCSFQVEEMPKDDTEDAAQDSHNTKHIEALSKDGVGTDCD